MGAELSDADLPPAPAASSQYTESGSDRYAQSSIAFFMPETFLR